MCSLRKTSGNVKKYSTQHLCLCLSLITPDLDKISSYIPRLKNEGINFMKVKTSNLLHPRYSRLVEEVRSAMVGNKNLEPETLQKKGNLLLF
jgi:hypothetical protein